MASEVMSIASCAASMALEEARAEVAKLRTEKYLMEPQLAKKAASPNKIFHDKILKETTNIAPAIRIWTSAPCGGCFSGSRSARRILVKLTKNTGGAAAGSD